MTHQRGVTALSVQTGAGLKGWVITYKVREQRPEDVGYSVELVPCGVQRALCSETLASSCSAARGNLLSYSIGFCCSEERLWTKTAKGEQLGIRGVGEREVKGSRVAAKRKKLI